MEKLVRLIRRHFNTSIPDEEEWLPASEAVALLLNDPENGVVYKSGHIEFGEAGAPFFETDKWSSSV